MHILGDIGNTDTKLFLVSTKHKIIKKLTFPSKNLNQNKLSKYFSLLKPNYQKINKILFCSVVPKSFNLIKKFLSKKTKINNKNNFIILDFGTATTFDVLIKDTYSGGIIAPGIRLSLDTLSNKATLIPKINLNMIKNVIGNDTVSAVRSGFFWGYAGLIDNIIKLIKKETRKSFKVIITGGFSNLFKKSINTKVYHNKDITINGLIKISNLIK